LRRRTTVAVLAIVAAAALVSDLARTPARQLSARAALTGIEIYQRTASRWLGSAGVSCRFTPTCSHYAARVIARDGALKGGVRTAGRIVRCGPWTPAGTIDQP